jgi:hypothetical protein
MVIAALVAFAILLVAWVMAPAEREATPTLVASPLQEVPSAKAA